MYALFEEAGKFLAGRVMSEADTSTQIELDSGMRLRSRRSTSRLKFEQFQPAELIAAAQEKSTEIEFDLAWEFTTKSALMMLVSAFASHGQVMALYRHALAQRYRFFSYGDSMLSKPNLTITAKSRTSFLPGSDIRFAPTSTPTVGACPCYNE